MQGNACLKSSVERTGLAPQSIDLVDYRVSQLGCAFCLDMHSKDLRARGEAEQRQPECAALAWGEAVTGLEDQQIPDAVYDTARNPFSEAELTHVALATVAIHGWNRFTVGFRTPAAGDRSSMVRKTG